MNQECTTIQGLGYGAVSQTTAPSRDMFPVFIKRMSSCLLKVPKLTEKLKFTGSINEAFAGLIHI